MALACGAQLLEERLHASPLGLPLGVQLYSVRDLLGSDFAGVLKQLAALGFGEVEAAGFYKHSAQEVRAMLNDAGVRMPSAHFSHADLAKDFDGIVEFSKAVGMHYLICSFPGFKNPARLNHAGSGDITKEFMLEDWRWNAEQFNKMGEKARAAGLQFGYHNHKMEFAAQDGVVPFDELIRLTDPGLVTIEMDCGWVVVGGADPVHYLERYPDRISMLHVKDFNMASKPGSANDSPVSTELGHGTIDYHRVFKAAKKAHIKHYFVEQESFDMPVMEAMKVDADYMKKLTV